MNYQAVIFDLDGTLLDTLEDLADSVNLVLPRNNLPEHEGFRTWEELIQNGAKILLEKPEQLLDK